MLMLMRHFRAEGNPEVRVVGDYRLNVGLEKVAYLHLIVDGPHPGGEAGSAKAF